MTTEHVAGWYGGQGAQLGGDAGYHHGGGLIPPQAAPPVPSPGYHHQPGHAPAPIAMGPTPRTFFQERVLVPKPWVGKGEGQGDDDGGDEEGSVTTTTTSGSSKKDGKAGAGGADKRGNYKCGRCGQPKKGHVCTNKPRLRTAYVERADAEVQSELDPELTVRQLDPAIQGFPESYGLSPYKWTPPTGQPGVPQPPSYQQPQHHQQQPPPTGVSPYAAAPPGPPYYHHAAAPPASAQPEPGMAYSPHQQQQQQHWAPPPQQGGVQHQQSAQQHY